jgi:polar amino acid transport system substrate-binding protein
MKKSPTSRHTPTVAAVPTLRRRRGALLAVTAAACAALAACNSSGTSPNSTGSAGQSTAGTGGGSAPFNSMLPEKIRSSGVLRDVSAFDYPPYDLTSASGALEGGEVDMLNAAAPLLGVKMSYSRLTEFSALIPAVTNGRVDMAGESIGITADRLKQVSFVEYGSIGEGLMVKKGNPSGLSTSDVCGHSVAVEAGAVEVTFYGDVSNKCTDAGKPKVTVDVYATEPAQVLAVESGHDDAVGVGSTTTATIAKSSKGALVDLPGLVAGGDLAIGFVVAKSDPQLGQALTSAIKKLQESGTLDAINKKWKLATKLNVAFHPGTD